AVLIGVWAFLTRTNVGLIIRAGTRDPLMVRALGIDLNRIWLLVFGIGCALAGLAGALAGPMRGAYAEMGVTMVIESFVVIVVGGMGSLLGAVVAGILMGQVVGMTTFLAPKLAEIMVFVVMALVLLVRPSGIFGEAGLAEWPRPPSPPLVAAPPVLVSRQQVIAFGIFFAVFPFLMPYQALASQVLIFGLFALGFNLLYGYTGLLSFGHAAYYGLGAYGTGLALAKLKVGSIW